MTVNDQIALPSDRAISPQQLIDAAIRLRPQLIADQAEVEERTYFSEEMHLQFEDAGFYRMYVPRIFGGLEVSVATFLKVAIEVARGDISTAWCLSLSANHALEVTSWYPTSVQKEVFGDGQFRAASMYAPTVTATAVDGGFELSGQVDYCSGIPYSTFFLGQARFPGTNADGSPKVGIYLAPQSQYTRLDNWGNTLGLKGSGSHSIVFDKGFVPDRLMLEGDDIVFKAVPFGTAPHNNPLYSGRSLCIFTMSLAAVVIGGGYNALDEYENQMRTRKTTLPPFIPRIEDADFLRWYGSARTKIGVAEAALMNVAAQHAEFSRQNASGEREYTFADDFMLSALARELMIQVWETVDADLYRTVGTAASKNGERFERIFRDLAQATGHRNPQLREPSYRTLAQFELGLI